MRPMWLSHRMAKQSQLMDMFLQSFSCWHWIFDICWRLRTHGKILLINGDCFVPCPGHVSVLPFGVFKQLEQLSSCKFVVTSLLNLPRSSKSLATRALHWNNKPKQPMPHCHFRYFSVAQSATTLLAASSTQTKTAGSILRVFGVNSADPRGETINLKRSRVGVGFPETALEVSPTYC